MFPLHTVYQLSYVFYPPYQKRTIVNYSLLLLTVVQIYIIMELWFTMEKLWYYGENNGTMEKNYSTMEKTMVLYRELWNFDLRRKKTIKYGLL